MKKEDKYIFLFMVVAPIGLCIFFLMWSRHGFIYSLLAELVYSIVAYFIFSKKK